MSKFLNFFYQRIIKRTIPHTLVSWRFFVPMGWADLNMSAYKLHKKVFLQAWPQIPRSLYVFGVIYSLLVWYFIWGPWFYTRHLIKRRCSKSVDQPSTGLTFLHYMKQSFFAYLRGLAPVSFSSLNFAELARNDWWAYVPNQVLPHWHMVLQEGYSKRSSAIISSKLEFAQAMAQAGLAVIPTEKVTSDTVVELAAGPALFFKPEISSQAKGCLIIEWTECGEAHLRSKDGKTQRKGLTAIRSYLNEALCSTSYLKQPKLVSHPDLTPFYDNHDLVVIRIVTLRTAKGFRAWRANLELPVLNQVFVKPYAIDVTDGRVGELDNFTLPCWADLVVLAIRAHAEVADLKSVGWDVALTDEGPILIEGNLNWGTSVLQTQGRGGLVDGDYLDMVSCAGLPQHSPSV
ncbi:MULTISPECIES: sugar-transfer associated ATP-grasp domain-containing protein [Idiomarinaceae]|uniref:Alpha-L-glutamate ligase-related protein ATP-grasp domain-containing protein n=1 Tax=Pseudidiomarina fusca TaxID=2965078 RepID=A0ABU3KXW8_9GAMM|nr:MULTISPECIES: sugar-transfer associated ATP-grasp domain-containing protein [Idiomarinaceae]MDT7526358.1 hypothetical protein [Pseudidiomarina sp. GXY010]NCU58799.1 hypothetical protein [Idiomarina sp. FenA--70]